MMRPTPWERLDGVKHALEAILELTVQWERERIIKRFEACLCFDKYDCEDKRCTDIMQFISIVKENN